MLTRRAHFGHQAITLSRQQTLDDYEETSVSDVGVILKRFESPDEIRRFELGTFEIINIGGRTIGRATYKPGWRWSQHVGPSLGLTRCPIEHVGLVLSGAATVAFADGVVVELRAGQLFYIPPTPHDSWVIGDEPYVSLHLLGAEHYATTGAARV
jgi:uncharacterized RmlC-like cupin family protein